MATVRRTSTAAAPAPGRLIALVFSGVFVLAYLGALIWLAWQSLTSTTEPVAPGPFALLVGGVGGALATNFGIVLGISMEQGKVRRITNLFGAAAADVNPLAIAAAWLYAGVLVAAPIVWFLDGVFSPATAEALRTLSNTAVGVGVASIYITLGLKPKLK